MYLYRHILVFSLFLQKYVLDGVYVVLSEWFIICLNGSCSHNLIVNRLSNFKRTESSGPEFHRHPFRGVPGSSSGKSNFAKASVKIMWKHRALVFLPLHIPLSL